MQNANRLLMGIPGIQGLPSPQPLLGSPSVRYITSGGSRSLFRYDSVVICNSLERITLHLPFIDNLTDIPDDYYYSALSFSISVVQGAHRVVVSPGNNINRLLTSVEVEETATRYDFMSTPFGWLYTIHKSSI